MYPSTARDEHSPPPPPYQNYPSPQYRQYQPPRPQKRELRESLLPGWSDLFLVLSMVSFVLGLCMALSPQPIWALPSIGVSLALAGLALHWDLTRTTNSVKRAGIVITIIWLVVVALATMIIVGILYL